MAGKSPLIGAFRRLRRIAREVFAEMDEIILQLTRWREAKAKIEGVLYYTDEFDEDFTSEAAFDALADAHDLAEMLRAVADEVEKDARRLEAILRELDGEPLRGQRRGRAGAKSRQRVEIKPDSKLPARPKRGRRGK